MIFSEFAVCGVSYCDLCGNFLETMFHIILVRNFNLIEKYYFGSFYQFWNVTEVLEMICCFFARFIKIFDGKAEKDILYLINFSKFVNLMYITLKNGSAFNFWKVQPLICIAFNEFQETDSCFF